MKEKVNIQKVEIKAVASEDLQIENVDKPENLTDFIKANKISEMTSDEDTQPE